MTSLLKTLVLALTVFGLSLVAIDIAHAQTTEPSEIAGGAWAKTGQSTSGSWKITEENGVAYVELGEDFKTRGAPDLKIFLSPTQASAANNANAIDNGVFVAKLENKSGAQRYALPGDVDLADYESVVIYCEAFSKFWASGDLG